MLMHSARQRLYVRVHTAMYSMPPRPGWLSLSGTLSRESSSNPGEWEQAMWGES